MIPVLVVASCSSSATPTPNSPPESRDQRIPQGSGDFSGALADAEAYKKGAISFEMLKDRVEARDLPPHPQGCDYLTMPVPAPPPGVKFDPWMMPRDWEHNFGEIAMTMWVGVITRDEYNRLHEAAHPGEKK
jgi:hypothetical protein